MKLLYQSSSLLLTTTLLFGPGLTSHAASSIFNSKNTNNPYSNIAEPDTSEDGNLRLERESYDLIRLNISDGTVFDEAVVYFTNGATYGFDANYDAHKIATGGLNISTYSNSDLAKEDMAINGVPDQASIYLPLKIATRENNNCTLTIEEYINTKGRLLYIYDKAANKYTPIAQGATYYFGSITGVSLDQFFITSTISTDIVTGITDGPSNSAGISIMPNPYNNGPLLLQLTGFGSGTMTIEISDTKGAILKLINLNTLESIYRANIENEINNLPADTYIIKCKSSSVYSIKKIVILK